LSKRILTIASEWASFEATLLSAWPSDARNLCRQLFYSGASSGVKLLMSAATEPQPIMGRRIMGVTEELKQFHHELVDASPDTLRGH
jgi:hypothetical protein